jgi:Flp pilus assembly protein TadB
MLGGLTGSLLVVWWQRRRMGGAERARQFSAAVRTGRLPDDADPAVWHPLLARERGVVHRVRAGVVVLLGLVVAAWGLVAVVGSFTWPAALISVALVIAVAVLVWAVSARTSARIDRLAEQLPDYRPRDRHSAR